MQIMVFPTNTIQQPHFKRSFIREIAPTHVIQYTNSAKPKSECKGDTPSNHHYQLQLYSALINHENTCTVNPNYMLHQTEINHKMRAILIDWLVNVHSKYQLHSNTLFLTVSFIDRYLEKVVVTMRMLQLVGVSAMLVACRYEETYAPDINAIICITRNAYNKNEIQEVQTSILQVVGNGALMPTSWQYLQYYAQLIRCEDRVGYCLCHYLIELSLMDVSMLMYPPSITAGGALYLAMKMLKRRIMWPNALKSHENELRHCAISLCALLKSNECLSKSTKAPLCSVKKKFSTAFYCGVSNIKIE